MEMVMVWEGTEEAGDGAGGVWGNDDDSLSCVGGYGGD